MNINEIGVFRGRKLIQQRGSVGGSRNVFVKLQGVKNELVYPTFGGVIKNPFKGDAKMFAGDLCEYRTNANGLKPEIYLLKTFEVVSNSTTTVNILNDGFRHKPCVGDVIMVAPETSTTTGTGVKITSVTETTVTVSSTTYNVWQVITSSSLGTLAQGTILVEATAMGATATMLVPNPNAVIDCDCDFFGTPKITNNTNLTPVGTEGDNEFDAVRYMYTPALGGLMYTKKMSPVPACLASLNRSRVNGWFKLDYYN